MNKLLTAFAVMLALAGHCAAAGVFEQAGAGTVPAASGTPPGTLTGTAVSVQAVPVSPTAGADNLKPAADMDEGLTAYGSVTNSADFNYRPAFVESRYSRNELFQDIEVSAVEAVPFGFLLTFAGIFVYESASQGTLQPKLRTLQDYTPTYAISIGALAALNVAINTLFFYDYKKEKQDDEKTEEK